MCFSSCQSCITKRGSRDVNESLVKTWAWLYLLNFKWHTCAYLMLTNPHSSPLLSTPRHVSSCLRLRMTGGAAHNLLESNYIGVTHLWTDLTWERVSGNKPPTNESVHSVPQLYCKTRENQVIWLIT